MKRKKYERKEKKKGKGRKKKERHMRWVLSKSMGKKENQTIRLRKINKNGMKPQEKEKMECREGCERRPKQNQQSQGEKKGEKEK